MSTSEVQMQKLQVRYEFFPVEKYLHLQGITHAYKTTWNNKLLANYNEIPRIIVEQLEQINVHDAADYNQLIAGQESFIAENFSISLEMLQRISKITESKDYELVFAAASNYKGITAVALLYRNVLQIITGGANITTEIQTALQQFPNVQVVYLENNNNILSDFLQNSLRSTLSSVTSTTDLLLVAQQKGYPVKTNFETAETIAQEICLMLIFVYLRNS